MIYQAPMIPPVTPEEAAAMARTLAYNSDPDLGTILRDLFDLCDAVQERAHPDDIFDAADRLSQSVTTVLHKAEDASREAA